MTYQSYPTAGFRPIPQMAAAPAGAAVHPERGRLMYAARH